MRGEPMGVNKIIYGGATLIDLTADTVTPDKLAAGAVAHNAAGESITGALATRHLYSGDAAPAVSLGEAGDVYLQLRQYDAGPPEITVSASYTTYQGALSNLVDGNTSTYWWSGTAQSAGAYVMLTFSAPANVTAVQVVTTNNTGDCASSGNKLQYTQDGSTWITVGSFNGSTTCTFSGLSLTGVKALRIYAASSASNWLCINEITVSRTAAADVVETTAYLRGSGGWKQLTDGSAINGAAITT